MQEKNPVIGHWKCGRGGRAEVTQTKKAGRHFNTRCDCCGFNQGTGSARQQDIWDSAEFMPGLTVVRPSNVKEKGESVSEPTAQPEPKAIGQSADFDPTTSEEASEEASEAGSDLAGKLLAGLMFAAALGVGIWMN